MFTCLEHVNDTRILLLSFATGSLPKEDIKLWFHSSGTMINNMYLSENIEIFSKKCKEKIITEQ